MQVGDKIKIKIFGEICCDYCNEIIHNHIDCPICNEKYSETDVYHELEINEIIECDNCNSEFKLLEEYYNDPCEVEIVKVGTINK